MATFAELEKLKRERDRLLADHAQMLESVNAEIDSVMVALGLGRYSPDGKKQPRMALAKTGEHATKRALAAAEGKSYKEWLDEQAARKLGITVAQLQKQRREEKIEAVKAGITVKELRIRKEAKFSKKK
jgi:hypothetical protein